MRKIVSMVLAALLVVVSLTGCGNGTNNAGKLSGSVSTNGSASMEKVIGILAEQFMTDNKDVTVTYDATGSGTGIEAVANDTCDIGLASRNLKDEEKAKGLVAAAVALDGIAIIVSENCPADDLSVEQIATIFTGEITGWAEFGGTGDIACIGREAGSGTRDGFESITKTGDKCVLAQELTGTGAVIAAVQSSDNAIGYDAKFAAPVLDIKKAVDHYTVYSGTLLIRNDADGKSYLYDLLDINKEKVISTASFSAEKRSEVIAPKPSQAQYTQDAVESQEGNSNMLPSLPLKDKAELKF